MKRKSVVRRLWILPLIGVFFLVCISAYAAKSAKASAMQMVKTEGTVSVSSSTGKPLPLLDKMRLYSGYRIQTAPSSYAWISLDDTKLIKMDASSQISVRKSGKKLEVLLDSGGVFFDVSEPLAADETLNVRVSTSIVGIRGTSGWVATLDSDQTQVAILDGSVTCTTTTSDANQRQTIIEGGESGTLSSGTDASRIESIENNDIPGFVGTAVTEDPNLCSRILNDSGLDLSGQKSYFESQLRADEQEAAKKMNAIKTKRTGQANQRSTSPVWGGGSNTSSAETSSRNERSSSSSSEASVPDESSESSSSSSVSSELTMPVSTSEIQSALDVYDKVRVQQ